MGSMIAGIIAGAVGGLSAFGSSLWGDSQAREESVEAQKELERLYALQLQEAELRFKQAQEEAERNAKKAELQADLADKSLDISEQGLSNDFNATIDNLYLSQEADAMNWNLSAMQAGSSEGAAYSNLAASGVRAGSSLSDAVLMESAVNENQLRFSKDQKRRSDENNLGAVLNQLAGNKVGIQQNRIGADYTRDEAAYLRNSYLEGGYNYNLYQNSLDQLQARYDAQKRQLNKDYAQHSGWNSFWNSFIALNTGSTSGFNTGYNVAETFQNSFKPEYSTTTGGNS